MARHAPTFSSGAQFRPSFDPLPAKVRLGDAQLKRSDRFLALQVSRLLFLVERRREKRGRAVGGISPATRRGEPPCDGERHKKAGRAKCGQKVCE